MSTIKATLIASVAVIVLATPQTAFAQDTSTGNGDPQINEDQGGEIIVTARKRGETLMSVPVVVPGAVGEQRGVVARGREITLQASFKF